MRHKLKDIPTDQLEVIHLSKTEYQRLLRGSDEIEINGKMYDIARTQIKEAVVIVFALHDSAEDNLLSFLDDVLKNATQDSQQASTTLFQFNLLSFVLPNEVISEDIALIQNRSFTRYSEIDLSFVCPLDTPPPRV
ncbi:MAG: hypothetical protein JJE09_11000 [Bacteroidia bacterium]|nr:hypothetical protein [Bacteroidia bacterium]